MKRYPLVLATCLLALSGSALAAGCATQSVAALVGSTCTIGDLTFDFTSYLALGDNSDSNNVTVGSGDAAEYAASAVTFTPTADGFNLAGNFSASSSLASYGAGQLAYTVQVTDGTLTGLTTQIYGASLSLAPQPDGVSAALTVAENFAYQNGALVGGTYVNPDEEQENGFAPTEVTYTNTATTDNLIYNSGTSFTGVTSETGYAFLETTVYNYSVQDGLLVCCGSGSATDSVTSADFGFQVTAPEPGVWWSLLAMGALAIVPIRRLQRGLRVAPPK
jgi:hypothetical protein